MATKTAKLDIAQRASYVSNVSNKEGGEGYMEAKTPDLEGESGALRVGGRPSLLSKDYFGVIGQYAAVGLVDAVLPSTIYPILQNYLNASGATALTASTLVALPWSFKFFYGILSDCLPIFGYRRRPYMVIGWTICIIMLLIMGCTPMGKPYWANPADAQLDPDADAEAYKAAVARANADAPNSGAKYVIMMMLSAFGYLLSDVCADAMVVELAQREPLAVRGTTQSAIYTTRTGFNIVGQLLTGFAFNGHEYGGSFDFSLSFPTLMLVLAICMCPVVPMTWFFIKEEKHAPAVFTEYMRDLWGMVQSRAVYQVMFYLFFANMFAGITTTAASPIQSILVHVTPLNSTIFSIIGSFIYMVGIASTGKWGLHWNWRWMIVVTGLLSNVFDAVTTFPTVWNVIRSQWFYLGLPVAANLPLGVNFLIGTFVIVEIAGEGQEGAMYGLLTTVSNLSSPFATTVTRMIDGNWDLSNERIKADTTASRWAISYTVIIMYACTAISWVFLFALPRQKQETQELKLNGGKSRIMGIITIVYVTFAFVWSVTTNLMGIFESTSCYYIAGGDGC
jgi:hypothetical protein